MKIAILGAKVIGGTLGRKWAKAGHEVVFGVRDLQNPEALELASSLGARLAPVGEAIAFGEVVVFAVPGAAVEGIVRKHGAALAGKIAVDAANRMGGGPLNSAAAFAAHAPGALLFRAFSTLGWENFENPRFGEVVADLFYCGATGAAQESFEVLVRDVGLEPVWLGGMEKAHLVDSMAELWFTLAFARGKGRHVAFKTLVR